MTSMLSTRGAVQAAEILGERQGEEAEVGEGLPCGAVEAVGGFRQRAAMLEGVILGDEAAQGVLQGELFFGVVEVHVVFLTGPKSSER
jgi:hypothetical protein